MEDKQIELTDAQKKARRARNAAIAFLLLALVVVFYLVTIFKFGPAVLNKAM